jgi:hypothetical protein
MEMTGGEATVTGMAMEFGCCCPLSILLLS